MESAPCGFKFPLKTIVMSIRLTVFGLCSLRGSERILGYFSDVFNGGRPCHVVIQNWVMRYGLYRLKKLKEKRDDWIFILDHTIEFGAKKCLVILGVTLETFRKNNCTLKHENMEVLAIDIVEKATSDTVTDSVCRVAKTVGVPLQIVSDNGSNIKRGTEDFIAEKFGIRKTYDVSHKAAIILKNHLKNDKPWKKFMNCTADSKRSLIHTILGYLSSPRPKDKARWLNLDMYISWAEKILAINSTKLNKKEKGKYRDKLFWLKDFRFNIKEWRAMLDLLQVMKNEVKTNGFKNSTVKAFEKKSAYIKLTTRRLKQIKYELIEYLTVESNNTGDKPWLGCSDIIESIIGKYKQFSAKTPMKEVGKAVLTMPVLTSTLNPLEIKKAMETVSAKDVENWLDENIGKSLFSKRKEAFSNLKTKKSVKENNENLKKAVGF